MAKQPIPDQIPRALLERACTLIDERRRHTFADSTKYDLLFQNRRYPPKAVVGIAAELVNQISYRPRDFSGGIGSKCFRLLLSEGFHIVPKLGGIEDENEAEERSQRILYEGNAKVKTIRQYERSREARKICIQLKGSVCVVCAFDFSKEYGKIGLGFIHVHPLEAISERNEPYQVDPKRDLVPVCPNCHAMMHRRQPPFSVEELKQARVTCQLADADSV